MDPENRHELEALLQEAGEIVDAGMGVLGSSVAKDHILVHLAGLMVGDWWETRQRKLPLRPPGLSPGEQEEEGKGVAAWEAHERAMDLTEAVLKQAGEKLPPLRVWETYTFFLTRSRTLGRGKGYRRAEKAG